MCDYLEVVPTLNVFLRDFHLQRLCDPDGKYSWVSFKQPKKLFAIYQYSVKHFKDRFFILKPLTRAAEEKLFKIVEHHETPHPSARFPLEWQYDHFQLEMESYIFRDEDMRNRDLAAYKKLIRY